MHGRSDVDVQPRSRREDLEHATAAFEPSAAPRQRDRSLQTQRLAPDHTATGGAVHDLRETLADHVAALSGSQVFAGPGGERAYRHAVFGALCARGLCDTAVDDYLAGVDPRYNRRAELTMRVYRRLRWCIVDSDPGEVPLSLFTTPTFADWAYRFARHAAADEHTHDGRAAHPSTTVRAQPLPVNWLEADVLDDPAKMRATVTRLRVRYNLPDLVVQHPCHRREIGAKLCTAEGRDEILEALHAFVDQRPIPVIVDRPIHRVDPLLLDLWLDYTPVQMEMLVKSVPSATFLLVWEATLLPAKPRRAVRSQLRKQLKALPHHRRHAWPSLVMRLERAFVAHEFAARVHGDTRDNRTDEEAEAERRKDAADLNTVVAATISHPDQPLGPVTTSAQVLAFLREQLHTAERIVDGMSPAAISGKSERLSA